MSAPGTRSIIWANGEDQFCLSKVGLILDLEAKCEAAIAVIFKRIANKDFYLNDLRETIRLGLIGGGMTPKEAIAAVNLHVDENPHGLAPSALVAYAVLEAVLVGVPDDPVGKAKPAADKTAGSSITTTDASAAPKSSASAPASAGRRASRKNALSGS
ncbi:gene transfer agent family protein [Bradyrhizobium lablabi]|uniref:gene transfer agent family protein n=1 Tax=Bradyrhizobium lablabi TaxID=722472 RepID=UPI001BA5BDA4|nr:gene transfer agent family protein [Bradyrhizobium lablabi]MBR0695946.1 gene transfer agent family protein [Bradyrhizobium lablabi]